jgi:hypothetical protein
LIKINVAYLLLFTVASALVATKETQQENVQQQSDKVSEQCAAIGLRLLNEDPAKYNTCTKWGGKNSKPPVPQPDNRSRLVFNVALSVVSIALSSLLSARRILIPT